MTDFKLDSYNLTPSESNRVGKAFIFNSNEFDGRYQINDNGKLQGFRYKTRTGSERDVEALESLFKMMNLETKVFKDLTKKKFEEELQNIATKYISKKDDKCVFVAIMSHGKEKNIFLKDGKYKLNNVFKTIGNCSNLKGKPKIFFIQACRGDARDCSDSSGFDGDEEIFTDSENDPIEQLVPKGSDFLACYATSEGYVSYRNSSTGCYFIQAIVNVITNYLKGICNTEDFLVLMTKVAQEVSNKHYTKSNKLQMPTFVSTLRKRLMFQSSGVKHPQSDGGTDERRGTIKEANQINETLTEECLNKMIEKMIETKLSVLKKQFESDKLENQQASESCE